MNYNVKLKITIKKWPMRKRRIPEQVNFGQLPAFKRKTFIYLEPQQDYPVVCLNFSDPRKS
jgi:hypothetical protein